MMMQLKTLRKKTGPGRSTRNPGADEPGCTNPPPGVQRRVKRFLLPCLLLIALAVALLPGLAFGDAQRPGRPLLGHRAVPDPAGVDAGRCR